jgi:hypothetical protein
MLRSVLLRAILLSAALLTLSNTSWATDVVLTHQGRLLDASDSPITGTRDILYRIYDSQTGGSELWSEMHASVSISSGLFTVSLGSTTPLSSDLFHGGGGGGGGALFERWLEIVVSGTVITPRTRLSATPFSAVSSSVSGDVETSPGTMIIHCTACSAVDGITLSSDVDSDELSMVRLNGLPPGTPYIGRVALSSSSSSSSIALGDLDADGALDMHCGPDSTVFDLGSADNGTVVSSYRAKAGKTGATKRMMYSSGGSTSSIGDDCDDGGAEMRMLNTASSSNQGWSLRCKPDSIVNEERLSDGRADVVLYKATTGKTGKAKQSLFMAPGGGTTEVDEDCGSTGAALRMKVDGLMGPRMSTNLTVGKQSSRIILEADLDGDGLVENSCASTSDSTHTGVSVSSRFGSGPRQTTSMDGTFSHAHMRCDSDSDDDGLADNSVVSDASSSGSSLRVISLNGLPPGEPVLDNIALSTDGSSSSIAVNEEGIECTMSGTVAGPVSPPQGRVRVAVGDVDGDGLSDLMCSPDSVNESNTVMVDGALMSSYTAKQGNTGRTKRTAAFALDGSRSTDDEVVSITSGVRRKLQTHNLGSSSQEGVSDLRCTPDSIVAENTISEGAQQKTLLYTAKQGKTGSASGKRTISPSGDTTSVEEVCDTAGVSLKLNIDSTPARISTNMTIGKQSSRIRLDSDSDGDGAPESEIDQVITPTTAGVAINTKGTGADKNRTIGSTCDDSSAIQHLDIDDDGDGHAEARGIIAVKGSTGSGSASASHRLTCDSNDNGIADVTAEMIVDADSACLRLNGLPPGVPVTGTIAMTASPAGAHMKVGLATCDGTNWVNASDKNAKENFQKVDGEELLEKISDLEITKWNYKGDKDAEHIGPTAQDFKRTFGVGADDKSISTIDPSGIALAAIKELYKKFSDEMKEKDAQIEQLQKEMKKLRQELQQKKN